MLSDWSCSTSFCSVSSFWATILNKTAVYIAIGILVDPVISPARHRVPLRIDYTGTEDKSDR